MRMSTYRDCAACGTTNDPRTHVCVSCGAALPFESRISASRSQQPSYSAYGSGLAALPEPSVPPISLIEHEPRSDFENVVAASASSGQQQQMYEKVQVQKPKSGLFSRREALLGLCGGAASLGVLAFLYNASRITPHPHPSPNPPIQPAIPAPLENTTLAPEQHYMIAFSANTRYMASANGTGTLQIQGKRTVEIPSGPVGAGINAIAWSPANEDRLACALEDGTVQIWSMTEKAVITTYRDHFGPVLALSWTSDGAYIASSDEQMVKVWNTSTLENHAVYDDMNVRGVTSLSWSREGNQLACAGSAAGVIVLDTLKSNYAVYASAESAPKCVAWSPDGYFIATGGSAGQVQLWMNRMTKRPLISDLAGKDTLMCLAWSPDSKYLAVGSWDKQVYVWKIKSGKLVQVFTGHHESIVDITWASNGQIASIDTSGAYQTWFPNR